jgi:hypothetical protein
VRVVLGSGEEDLRIHEGVRNRVVLDGIGRRVRVRVTVIARDARLRPSRPAEARLRPGQRRSSGQR